MTYSQKIAEIESILESFEMKEIDFDQVREKIIRAVELINQCKSELKTSEEEIQKLLDDKSEK